MKWFKHYTKSMSDAKIEKLIMKYGIEGYGVYFGCLEIISGNLTVENITFELEHDVELLAYKFKIDSIKLMEIMKYCISLGLFEFNETNQRISCLKLLKYIDDSTAKNPEIKKIVSHCKENSELFGIIPKESEQIRLDKIREDNNNNYVNFSNEKYDDSNNIKTNKKTKNKTEKKQYIFEYEIDYKSIQNYFNIEFEKATGNKLIWSSKEGANFLKFIEILQSNYSIYTINSLFEYCFKSLQEKFGIYDKNKNIWLTTPTPSLFMKYSNDIVLHLNYIIRGKK